MTSMSKRYENIQSLYLCKHLLTYSEHLKWVRNIGQLLWWGGLKLTSKEAAPSQKQGVRTGGHNYKSWLYSQEAWLRNRGKRNLSRRSSSVCVGRHTRLGLGCSQYSPPFSTPTRPRRPRGIPQLKCLVDDLFELPVGVLTIMVLIVVLAILAVPSMFISVVLLIERSGESETEDETRPPTYDEATMII